MQSRLDTDAAGAVVTVAVPIHAVCVRLPFTPCAKAEKRKRVYLHDVAVVAASSIWADDEKPKRAST